MKLPLCIEKLLTAINDNGTVRSIVQNGIEKDKNHIKSVKCFKGDDDLLTLKDEASQNKRTLQTNADNPSYAEQEESFNQRVTTGAWIVAVIALWCEEENQPEWAKKIRAVGTNKDKDASWLGVIRSIERSDTKPL